jgi:hypothetical protein
VRGTSGRHLPAGSLAAGSVVSTAPRNISQLSTDPPSNTIAITVHCEHCDQDFYGPNDTEAQLVLVR